MKIITDERCVNYSSPGHPERPARITATLARLRAQTELPIIWAALLPVDDKSILRAHTAGQLTRLAEARDFDADTPWFPEIADHARRSAGAGLAALQSARAG